MQIDGTEAWSNNLCTIVLECRLYYWYTYHELTFHHRVRGPLWNITSEGSSKNLHNCLPPFHTLKGFLRRNSLAVQWLRICLAMQGTWIRSLVQEDSTCCGAAKPTHHNYWACTLEPSLCNAKLPQAEACALQWRVALARPTREDPHTHSNEDPAQP